jgi:hypothetical protein
MDGDSESPSLMDGFEIEEALRDLVGSEPAHQHCLRGEEELLLFVHEVPRAGVPERQSLAFWKHPAKGWFGPGGEPGLGKLEGLLERYELVIDEHEASIESIESSAQLFPIIKHARPLARSSRNLTVALERAVSYVENDRELRTLRDWAREIERAAELLFHDSKLTLDYLQAQQAEDQQEATERLNRIAFRLNLLAGFFLPLVALGGLFGMNVDLPEFLRPMFWVIFWIGLLTGGVLVFLVGRKTFPNPIAGGIKSVRSRARARE